MSVLCEIESHQTQQYMTHNNAKKDLSTLISFSIVNYFNNFQGSSMFFARFGESRVQSISYFLKHAAVFSDDIMVSLVGGHRQNFHILISHSSCMSVLVLLYHFDYCFENTVFECQLIRTHTGGGVLRFELDRGVPLEPQNPYPSLRVILAKKGTHF